jgi:two-component system, chemotaxis family, chemotaxis protein CheY
MEKTIVIADDSASVRDLVSFTLETAGYRVLCGIDGTDALKHFNGTSIDLVITDLHMPKLDGINLIKEIRSKNQYQFTPIILLTTESQTSKKQDAKAAGATGWIVKPFVQEKLLEVVQKLVKR